MDENPWKAMTSVVLRMTLQLAVIFLALLQIAVVFLLQVALLVTALACGIFMAVGLVTQTARLFGLGFVGFLILQLLFPAYIETAFRVCDHAIDCLIVTAFQGFVLLYALLCLALVLASMWTDRISLALVGLIGLLILQMVSKFNGDQTNEGAWEDGWKSKPPQHLLSNRMKHQNEVIDDVKELWK